MPLLKITDVISFSSEDPVNSAENILSPDPAKKWKCQKAGEKSANIILQLEKASVISSIHIGNESSAYIEVLVNRSSSTSDFKVLLVMSSFMTPVEARQGANPNKVRMFTADQLSKPECNEKWDRIKIVCTQPFNKQIQFGLSFVNFYSPEDKANESLKLSNFGSFTLRPDSPDKKLHAGSLFARRKELQSDSPKAATAIREASASLNLSKPKSAADSLKRKKSDETLPPPKKQNVSKDAPVPKKDRNDLLYKDDEKEVSKKMEKAFENRDKEKESEKKTPKDSGNTNKTPVPKKPKSNGNLSKQTPKKPTEPKSTPKKEKPKRQKKAFNKLLEDVVIVISGIQNPERGDIRTAALSMGAKYKPDWQQGCTHLICAFPNTPKFNQVKGKGKIIKKKWVLDCEAQRKRLPWRRYALDPDDKKKDESEDEIWELTEEDREETQNDLDPKPSTSTAMDDDYVNNANECNSDGSDTEDEIERIRALQDKDKNKNGIYDNDTDEEDSTNPVISSRTPELPDFFTNLAFFIDDNIPEDIQNLLKRYIVAFNGVVKKEFTEVVTTIVSTPETVSVLQLVNPEATFVSPDWIWDCHNKQSFVPVEEYLLV